MIRYTRRDVIFNAFNYTFLTIGLVLVLYPVIYIISASFSDAGMVASGRVFLLPVKPTLAGYEAVFNYPRIWIGYANSLYYAVVGTSINIVMTILAAYPLSRRDFKGRNAIMALMAFTMFFSGGMVPLYLLINKLGILNTRWAMVIPNAVAVFNIIVARTYIQTTIPDELLDASRIDGCSDTRFIIQVVVPLCKPLIAVLCLWYAVGHWNSFFPALIYLKDVKLFPLQIILREVLVMNVVDMSKVWVLDFEEYLKREQLRELLKYSLIVVASVPVLLIYPFAQRYFVKGIMIGAIKG